MVDMHTTSRTFTLFAIVGTLAIVIVFGVFLTGRTGVRNNASDLLGKGGGGSALSPMNQDCNGDGIIGDWDDRQCQKGIDSGILTKEEAFGFHLGDVNGDLKVTGGDVTLYLRYLLGSFVPTEKQKYRMDVNGPTVVVGSVVDWQDLLIVQNRITGFLTVDDMEGVGLGDPTGDFKISSGDVTFVKRVMNPPIDFKPTNRQIVAANINGSDGVDCTDVRGIAGYIIGFINQPNEWQKLRIGDTNEDGVYSSADTTILLRWVISGGVTGRQLVIGDLNGDSKLTKEDDVDLLQKLIVGSVTVNDLCK